MNKKNRISLIDDNIVNVWINLHHVQQTILQAIEEDLKEAGFPPLAWYDVLFELMKAPNFTLRPFEIEKKTLLNQYNLSRLLDRLQKKSLIKREICGKDKRGLWIVLTAEGQALCKKMWPCYAHSITKHIGQKLNMNDINRLTKIFCKLKLPYD
ncbi:MAG: MarR family transcriptional regulator [Alphaproteobacteria bacterium]|nr:MarR family transcriptional regulator [Alphaproteobacteria bacterium]